MAVTVSCDNADLVELARAGDPPALERLLAKSLPDVRRYAKRSCASDDIDEAVQDALWILYRNVGGLKSVAAFAGWLLQIVRRICLSYSMRRRTHLSIDKLTGSAERDWTVSDPEMRAILSRILTDLPKAYRETIILKDSGSCAATIVRRQVPLRTRKANRFQIVQ